MLKCSSFFEIIIVIKKYKQMGTVANFKIEFPAEFTAIVVGSKRKYRHARIQWALIFVFLDSCILFPPYCSIIIFVVTDLNMIFETTIIDITPYSIFIKTEICGCFALKFRCTFLVQVDNMCLNKHVRILMCLYVSRLERNLQ